MYRVVRGGSCQLNPDMIGPGSRFPGAVMHVYPDGDVHNSYCHTDHVCAKHMRLVKIV